MSCSAKIYNAAVSGCLTALIAASLCTGAWAQDRAQTERGERSVAQAVPPADLRVPQTGEGPRIIPQNRNAAPGQTPGIYRPDCAQPKDRDEADLCQQERLAEAARDSARYVVLQTIIGSVGLALLLGTLIANALATRAAARAASFTAETVRVMRNAERPYVRPFDVAISASQSPYEDSKVRLISFGLENIGRGLGVIRGYGIAHEICLEGRQGNKRLTTTDQFGGFTLAQGSRWRAEEPFEVFPVSEHEFIELVTTETKTLYVYGYIRYADLFDVVRRTGFAYEVVFSPDGAESVVISVSNRGLWYDYEEKAETGLTRFTASGGNNKA